MTNCDGRAGKLSAAAPLQRISGKSMNAVHDGPWPAFARASHEVGTMSRLRVAFFMWSTSWLVSGVGPQSDIRRSRSREHVLCVPVPTKQSQVMRSHFPGLRSQREAGQAYGPCRDPPTGSIKLALINILYRSYCRSYLHRMRKFALSQ